MLMGSKKCLLEETAIFVERNCSGKSYRSYYKSNLADGKLKKTVSQSSGFLGHKWLNILTQSFHDVFLPQGYPFSVSSDYMVYQIWDTVQAFCSTINGTLTTHAIFKGVGVGDVTATALSATFTWILKDGTGMIGRIGFAWWKGYSLDTDCKIWRLAADIINDAAMFFELLLGFEFLREFSPVILCFSTGMKSIVGVSGGATRASITQHQAIRNNMGDVSAKDGSQETCVNLIASFLGFFILTLVEGSSISTWIIFIMLTVLHIFANYKAVKNLKLKTLNTSRMNLIVQSYLQYNQVFDIARINHEESVFLGYGLTDKKLCGKKICLGYSFEKTSGSKNWTMSELANLKRIYASKLYFILFDEKYIYVMLHSNAVDEDIIMAYFHALVLGIVKQQNNDVFSKYDLIKDLNSSEIWVSEFVSKKWIHFRNSLNAMSWNISQHQLLVYDWRIDWTD